MSLDDLDHNLRDAWSIVCRQLQQNPAMAARRQARQRRAILQRPPRAWCAALRASDTRISIPSELHPDNIPGQLQRLRFSASPHEITLTAPLIASLIQPVYIPKPTYHLDACKQLGITPGILYRWLRQPRHHATHFNGRVKVDFVRGWPHGLKGKPRPWIWSFYPFDPQAMEAEPPDPVWGTLWRYHHERIPPDFHQQVQRIPRLRAWRGQQAKFRGWLWKCPRCSKPCRKMFLPLPIWSMDKMLSGGAASAALPIDLPLRFSCPSDAGFACQMCIRPLYFAATDVHGAWNTFVTHISNGLLVGREVARPRGVLRNPVRRLHPNAKRHQHHQRLIATTHRPHQHEITRPRNWPRKFPRTCPRKLAS